MPRRICTGFCCFFLLLGPTESACTRRVQARNKTRRNAPAGPVLMDVNHRVFGRIAARLCTYRVTALITSYYFFGRKEFSITREKCVCVTARVAWGFETSAKPLTGKTRGFDYFLNGENLAAANRVSAYRRRFRSGATECSPAFRVGPVDR